jgi:hypothetical protein
MKANTEKKAAPVAKAKLSATKSAEARMIETANAQKATQLGGAIKAWARADSAEQGALVEVFRQVATLGVEVTTAMLAKYAPNIAEASRPVYVSTFNKAHKVAKIIGTDAAVDLINKAAAMPGRKWERVRDTLGTVQTDAKAVAVKLATVAQRETFVTSAILAEAVKDDNRAAAKAKKRDEAKAAREPQAPSIAPAPVPYQTEARQDMAALQVLTAKVARYACPPERTDAQRKAIKALQDAHELLAVLTK